MSAAAARRMSKPQRREQLLETAQRIVRNEGTEVLTLGYLAERAGVSKPIAYEHFGTRPGLLMALYGRIDELHVKARKEALAVAPATLEGVARVIAEAFMHCYAVLGDECHVVAAAMKGDETMDAFQAELMDRYVALYHDAFRPYATLPDQELHLRCTALIGAAEALSREMLRGRTTEADAAACLSALIVSSLSRPAPTGSG
ncbi:MAG: TetR/AcrR family transcriptional regulator [Ectothiorhodospiraceae bacterium]|nr:TetR/AcrR family transcriptional regulator [Ectothiorhodospiraceae bacterium]